MHRLTIDSKEGDAFRYEDRKAWLVKRFTDKGREYIVFRQWQSCKRRWNYRVERLTFSIQMSNISR